MTTKSKRDVRAYNRAYRDKNKEKLKRKRKEHNQKSEIRKQKNKWNREWYQKNRKKLLLGEKAYRKNHPHYRQKYHKKWYKQNRDKILEQQKKYLSKLENKERRRKYEQKYRQNPKNISRMKKYQREWAKKNPDKIKKKERKYYYSKGKQKKLEYRRIYRHTEKGRLSDKNRKYNRRIQKNKTKNRLTTNELIQIYKEYPSCIYCHSKKDLTIEHIKALKNDGQHSKENVMMACRKCNASKNSTPLKIWLQKAYCKENNINWNTIHPNLLKFRE